MSHPAGGEYVIIDPRDDDGELVEEIYENMVNSWVRRDQISAILETLVRLDYNITYWKE